ncbi:NusG domain II-containing protein [Enterococcus lemanii]|uniref:NusG domain II-containing protein n=1 Tax=Enterococcus lemanii TaxID=1159752 RepID=A0ABV9MUT5_9ENTE|nr:NusG domain II-containing protein [Enterococcus lemanii]MBM7708465.1 hypothetical protein [Enterococcus lemanii]NLM68042.1 hypothetical protein [Enterococcus sp.]
MMLKNFIQTSRLKRWDFIIILFLILASFTPLFLFGWQKLPENVEMQAILRVDGQEITTFQLVEGKKGFTYLYEDEDGDTNLLEIDGSRIRIKEADCGDQICVRRGWASKNGETIVCLPHKLVIEIKALDGSEQNDLIY